MYANLCRKLSDAVVGKKPAMPPPMSGKQQPTVAGASGSGDQVSVGVEHRPRVAPPDRPHSVQERPHNTGPSGERRPSAQLDRIAASDKTDVDRKLPHGGRQLASADKTALEKPDRPSAGPTVGPVERPHTEQARDRPATVSNSETTLPHVGRHLANADKTAALTDRAHATTGPPPVPDKPPLLDKPTLSTDRPARDTTPSVCGQTVSTERPSRDVGPAVKHTKPSIPPPPAARVKHSDSASQKS